MKDPRRPDRTTTDEPATEPDVPLDPVVGLHGGVPLPPRGGRRPEEEPPRGADTEDPRTTRMAPELDTPSQRPAVLGRLEGLGLVVVVRHADGGISSAEGTWRPGDESASRDELQRTFPEGSTTRYAGTLIEARDDDTAREVSLEVVIKHHGEYEAGEGRTRHVVNFDVPDFR